ncbi:MAG: transporter substrate-binding domain-containing protein [Trichococcus flocculiformis]|jgi:putative lysine transport system substrate-binding protein|nr:transporter substrate-binding domain-containing protein [Trichococcus flocculiformis]HRA69697.1 transporter substrate-binding domain-containing protein [Trichococcus flocculiformis]
MKVKTWKTTMAALMGLFILAGCGNGTTEDSSAADGSAESDAFVVGMEAGYPPFNWTQNDDSNGAVKIDGADGYANGYDVQMAQKVADGLGKELVIVKTEWDGLVPALVSSKIDAIVAGMSPTDERKEAIDFSDSYYTTELVIVVKSDGAYANATTLADFADAKVTAQLNTLHYGVIDQIEGVQKQPAMDSFTSMRVALESGTIDAYVSERPEAISASAANSAFKMIELNQADTFELSVADSEIAIGLIKESELKDQINEILSGITEEERIQMMEEAIKNQPSAE